jgi:hypothetical protein
MQRVTMALLVLGVEEAIFRKHEKEMRTPLVKRVTQRAASRSTGKEVM